MNANGTAAHANGTARPLPFTPLRLPVCGPHVGLRYDGVPPGARMLKIVSAQPRGRHDETAEVRHDEPPAARHDETVTTRHDEAAAKPPALAAARHRAPRAWPLIVIGGAAAVAIWSGWVALGAMCGFGLVEPLPGIVRWHLDTAITLPVSMEAYGAYALGAWLSPGTPERARKFARSSSVISLAVGTSGQVIYHLLAAAHRTAAPWPVVMLVSCIPVAALGMAAALAHLLRDRDDIVMTNLEEPVMTNPVIVMTKPEDIVMTKDEEPVMTNRGGDEGTPAAPPVTIVTAPAPETMTKPAEPVMTTPAARRPAAVKKPSAPSRPAPGDGSKTAAAKALLKKNPGMTAAELRKAAGVSDATARRVIAAANGSARP